MPYHVRIVTSAGDSEVRVGLDKAELNERFLEPYRAGQPIVIGGRTIAMADLERMQITYTEEDVPQLAQRVRRQHKQQLEEGVIDFFFREEEAIVDLGDDVSDELITSPPGTGPRAAQLDDDTDGTQGTEVADPSKVFVVHGRNDEARSAMFAFLRSLTLNPIEWSEARQATRKPSPYIGEILDAAFSMAAAVVVLMTPDDLAHLHSSFQKEDDPPHETEPTPQARPNVLFEAGMAMGRDEERTVLVELGTLRPFSDTAGRHVVRLTDSTQDRQELANRLLDAGADVSLIGTDWHTTGEFEASIAMDQNA